MTARSAFPRLASEFVVIVAGVLIALAADRWNQGRADAQLEASYVERLTAEIRNDSLMAANFLAQVDEKSEAVESLIGFVDGGAAPEDLITSIRDSWGEFQLPPTATWIEVLETGGLQLISEPEVRAALTQYYATRRTLASVNIERSVARGRDPYLDVLYPMGLFRDRLTGPRTACINTTCFTPIDPDDFRQWPGIRSLLLGMASTQGSLRIHVAQLLDDSSSTLRTLEAAQRR